MRGKRCKLGYLIIGMSIGIILSSVIPKGVVLFVLALCLLGVGICLTRGR